MGRLPWRHCGFALIFPAAGPTPRHAERPARGAAGERGGGLRRLRACLDKLEPRKRQMVLLAYCHGASREALAARYAAPVPTVKTWLHRSLAQLRLCLGS